MSGTEIVLECEHPDCKTTFATGRSFYRDAEIEGREAGWQVDEGHEFCPEHKGEEATQSWTPKGSAPAKLVAGVNWWLNSDPAHAEDVVMVADDGQDALILSGLNDVMCVVWVNPEGHVRTLKGRWDTVHQEVDEDAFPDAPELRGKFTLYSNPNAFMEDDFFFFEETKQYPERRVWTIVEGESGQLWAQTGYHIVNKIGYVITLEEWTDADVPIDYKY